MDHPKAIGDRSALAALLGLEAAGWAVYVPFGENTGADFVIDNGQELARVQCKTGRLRKGAIQFKVCSSYAHHSNPASRARDYLGEIDWFAVYCPETAGVYLVPIRDIELKWHGSLRIDPPRNNQRKRVRSADRYLVAKVSARATAEPDASSGAPVPSA
jgi:hypothetical protein